MSETPGGEQPQDPYPSGYWEQQAPQPGQQGQPGYPPGYGPGYGPAGPVQYAPDHPQATMALVLGVLGLLLCQILGPVAWAIGRRTVAEIDASNGTLGGRGAAQAGMVMGIISTVLLGLALVVLLVLVVFFVVLGVGVSTTT